MTVNWKPDHQYNSLSRDFLENIDKSHAMDIRKEITDDLSKVYEAIDHATEFLRMLERHRADCPNSMADDEYHWRFSHATEHIRNHRRRVAKYERMLAQIDAVFPLH